MAIGNKINLKQSAKLAAVVTGGSLIVAWLFSTVLKTVVTPLFASIPAVSPITSTLGNKVIGLISGVIPIGDILGFGVIALFITALLIVIAGEYLIDSLKLPTFKGFLGINGNVGRLASVILWGAVPVYGLLVGFTVPTLMTFVGVAIYTFAVAVVSVFGANLLKIKI